MTHPALHGSPSSRFSEQADRDRHRRNRSLLIGTVVIVGLTAALIVAWSLF